MCTSNRLFNEWLSRSRADLTLLTTQLATGSIDGGGEIHVQQPQLPIGVDQLTIHRLMVAGASVDLTFQRLVDRVVVFSQSHT